MKMTAFSVKISLKFVFNGLIDNELSLAQIRIGAYVVPNHHLNQC